MVSPTHFASLKPGTEEHAVSLTRTKARMRLMRLGVFNSSQEYKLTVSSSSMPSLSGSLSLSLSLPHTHSLYTVCLGLLR
jgi:hypothetical protein